MGDFAGVLFGGELAADYLPGHLQPAELDKSEVDGDAIKRTPSVVSGNTTDDPKLSSIKLYTFNKSGVSIRLTL